MRELFCYLLLNRDYSHSREKVASDLWGDYCTTSSSKKYLRDAIWRLKSFISSVKIPAVETLLEIDPDWIRMNSLSRLELDIQTLEQAYAITRQKKSGMLTEENIQDIEQAVGQYRGDLLETWQQDWCIFERERFVQIYLTLLDCLMDHYVRSEDDQQGVMYGRRILKIDAARECTHRDLMQLYAKAGHRTDAVRQYYKCVSVLKEELDIEPSSTTTALFERINTDFQSFRDGSIGASDQKIRQFDQVIDDIQLVESTIVQLNKHFDALRHKLDIIYTGGAGES